MKRLITLLAITVLLPSYMLQGYSQEEEVKPLTVAIVMESFTCDYNVISELMDFSYIVYFQIQQYYVPNVPQVYCFTELDEYAEAVYDFIVQYNDYVIVLFEDNLWGDYAEAILSEKFGIESNVEGAEGEAFVDYGVIVLKYYNSEPSPNEYIETHDFNSITLTHELAHLILYDYGYDESVYADWVHETDVFYNKYETGYEIYSPYGTQWYEVFERYPVEEDF